MWVIAPSTGTDAANTCAICAAFVGHLVYSLTFCDMAHACDALTIRAAAHVIPGHQKPETLRGPAPPQLLAV